MGSSPAPTSRCGAAPSSAAGPRCLGQLWWMGPLGCGAESPDPLIHLCPWRPVVAVPARHRAQGFSCEGGTAARGGGSSAKAAHP